MAGRGPRVVIWMLLVLILGSGWPCHGGESNHLKPDCPNSDVLDVDGSPLPPHHCKLLPCGSGGGRLFILPDRSSTSTETDLRSYRKDFLLPVGLERPDVALCSSRTSLHLLDFLPFAKPPFFLLKCSFLC